MNERTEITVKQLSQIDVNTIKRAYSGKPGCGCGCRGNYTENKATIKRLFKNALALAETLPVNTGGADDLGVQANEEGPCYYLESNVRYYWFYTYT